MTDLAAQEQLDSPELAEEGVVEERELRPLADRRAGANRQFIR